MLNKAILFFFLITITGTNTESYIPRYIEGTPLSAHVVSIQPPDLRGSPLFRIEFEVETTEGTLDTAGLVHRTYQEFATLNKKIGDDFWLPDPAEPFPQEDQATVDAMDKYLQGLFADTSTRQSTIMCDFVSINWNGKDITFMYDLAGFLQMLLFERVPHFMPEPPRIEKDAAFIDETPFERYMYFTAFKHPKEETPAYLDFFNSYCETTPTWEGLPDNRYPLITYS